MLVIYEAVEGMTKIAKGAIRLPYDQLSAYDAFEVLAPASDAISMEFIDNFCGYLTICLAKVKQYDICWFPGPFFTDRDGYYPHN